MPKIAVVGGGVVGATIASEIAALREFDVHLFETRAQLGSGVTSSAIGGITPQSESFCRGPLRHVAVWSTELFRPLLNRLEDQTGKGVPVLDSGQIVVARTEHDMERLLTTSLPAWELEGFDTHVLSQTDLMLAEPLLSRDLVGGLLLPIEFALDPGDLMSVLFSALSTDKHVRLRMGERVSSISSCATHAAITSESGRVEEYDVVVVATGMLAKELIPELAERIYPMRGQAIEFETPSKGYALNHHVYAALGLNDRSSYMVPRWDGRVAAGVTYEPNSDSEQPDRETIEKIKSTLGEVCPSSLRWNEIRAWSGVRPASFDGIPIIGFADEHERIVACAGHQGLGVTLAPASARMVSALCTRASQDAETSHALKICSIDRPKTTPTPN